MFRALGLFPAASACDGKIYQCLLCDAVTNICECETKEHSRVGCGHAAVAFADQLPPPVAPRPDDAPDELGGIPDPQWATVALLQVVTAQLSEIIDLLRLKGETPDVS